MSRAPHIVPARTVARGRLQRAPLVIGGFLVAVVAAAALVSLLWTPYPANALDFAAQLQPPSRSHPLGTDAFGRDLASRILVGARGSLLVGVLSVSIGLGLGGSIGLVAGWAGGWLDEVLMRIADVLYAFPAILMALLLAAIYQPGIVTAMVAIGIAMIPLFARIARASAISVRTAVHVEAGRAIGATPRRLLLRYVLPEAGSPLVVQTSLSLAVAVLAEAALSFLGLGSPPDVPSWGSMLRDAQGFLAFSPWPAVVPGLAIVWTVLGWSLLGDGLRDVLDPKTR